MEKHFLWSLDRLVTISDGSNPTKADLVDVHEGAGAAVAIGEDIHDINACDHIGIKV